MAKPDLPEGCRFEIVAGIGHGGQGSVWKVRDKETGAFYALKTLSRSSNKKALERFRREIDAIKTVRDPAIVGIVATSESTDRIPYYVMEYHEGAVPLGSLIGNPSSQFLGNPVRALSIYEQLVRAIGACQLASSPIVHRDIKPANVLLLPDGAAKLIDFGICHVCEGVPLTSIDENVGARNYCAPECEAGSTTPPGVYSDLYSAAKVLWALVANEKAFAREDPVRSHKSMRAMFPSKPELWHLQCIFDQSIQEAPSARFQSASAALEWVAHVRLLVQRGFAPLEAPPATIAAIPIFYDITIRGAENAAAMFVARIQQHPILGQWGDEELPGGRRRISFRTGGDVTDQQLLDEARELGLSIENLQSRRIEGTLQALNVRGTRPQIDVFCTLLSSRLGIQDIRWFEFAPNGYVVNFDMPNLPLDVVNGFAAAAGVVMEPLRRAAAADSDAGRGFGVLGRRRIHDIQFAFEDSVDQHGWAIAVGAARFTSVQDPVWGRFMEISPQGPFAMDYAVPADARHGVNVAVVARELQAYFYVKVRMWNAAEGRSQEGSIAFVQGRPVPYRFNETEWWLAASPEEVGGGVSVFRMNLRSAMQLTFGMAGWSISDLLGFRIGGEKIVSISRIEVYD